MDTSVSPQQQATSATLPADIPMPQMAPGMAAPMMPGAMMPGKNFVMHCVLKENSSVCGVWY